ncbi:MAG: bifunctional (p)ppGpp synthetase/guanosine-3',5'-bis(diphosphate) 3'-pyrophosphohydrolase [Firmicutes bacterium]|nr:bifunctional (p)ppGpp synthetase/guanosine-3',5'-bis(diphosphate) 3'-pyrophosphohydrolase [Bacillota bacterium]
MDTVRNGSLDELLDILKSQGGNYDIDLITKAYNACKRAHEGQVRLSGEPFYIHPFSVACIIAGMGMDSESIAAALLHDTAEDTAMTIEDIRREFGNSIMLMVDGVTKMGKLSVASKEQQQAENIRKMMLAMAEDIRVIIIKLADRLHNMRTIDAQSPIKILEKSLETLEVYAPIAHRLGIRAVKEELEDLSIKHLDPIGYNEIEQKLEQNREYRARIVESIKQKLTDRLAGVIDNMQIEGRVKSIHGIYRKMFMQGKQFEEIYDIYAVRVIVNTINDCYNVLGMVHEMFRPIPGRFKDYISTPKANMYQSLHTTVITGDGAPFEVQIRTWDMHHTAEYGIAAHWKYKDGVSRSDERFEKRLSWIRQMLENQKEADDVEEIVRTIKTDLAPDDVFCMTPKGDVISLPAGSTVIDFAYAIHSAVGNRMTGAKVDGRIVPLDHKVQTGEVIEIITSSQTDRGPNRDWLNIVKTSEARTKIRGWFKKERLAENIEQGRAAVEHELSRNGIRLPDEEMQQFLNQVVQHQHCNDINDFYAKVGYGGISITRLMPRLKEDYNKIVHSGDKVDVQELVSQRQRSTHTKEGIVVEGIDNCLVKLSRCCTPIPGDSIIGFITRGHGVSIHKRDCVNVPHDLSSCEEPDRWVPAHWDASNTGSFDSTIHISAFNRDGVLADVTVAIVNMRVPLHSVNARETKNGNCAIDVTVRVESVEHLQSIVTKLSKINGVFSVDRGAL